MGPELLLLIAVLVVVLLWRGPSNLPRLGESLGRAVKGARENMPSSSKQESSDSSSSDDPPPPA